MCKLGLAVAAGVVVILLLAILGNSSSGFVSTEWLNKIKKVPQPWMGPIGTRDIVRQGAAPY